MTGLDSIPVQIEVPAGGRTVGSLAALLAELREALHRLAGTADAHRIDLHGLPMAPEERAQLRERLGRGEVAARLDALGESELFETALAGVWWICHRDAEGRVVAEYLDVTLCPDLLPSDPAAIAAGIAELDGWLEGGASDDEEEDA